MAKPPVSLRWSLLRSFLLLVLISSLSLFAMMQYRAAQSEKTLSLKLTQRGLDSSRSQLDHFLDPARFGVEVSAHWGRDGLLDIAPLVAGLPGEVTPHQVAALERLNQLFLPIIKSRPLLSLVTIANARGEGWGLVRLADGQMRNWIVARDSWGVASLWFDVGHDGTLTGATWEQRDADLRERPWYQGATKVRPGQLHWTEPYTFITLKQPGLTVSSHWKKGDITHVIGWDVLLTTLSDFTQHESSRVSDRSIHVIMDSQHRMLGLPSNPRYRDPDLVRADLLKPAADIANPVVQAAVNEAARVQAAGGAEALKVRTASGETISAISFDAEGEEWWAAVAPYPLPGSGGLRFAVIIPSSDLIGEITQLRIGLLISTVVALIGALVFALFMTRSYSRPLEALVAQSRRIRQLDFSASEPIAANVREVRELADAQAQSLAAVESFSRYVPVEVVRELVAAGDVARIGGSSTEMTMLFTDIADFTRLSEGLEPQALADHMAAYFDALIDIIQKNHGTVDKLVGDAIVAFWGAPRENHDHATGAVAAALACQQRLKELNAVWRDAGAPPLVTRFGLASGTVIVGNFGAPDRLAYTVLGDKVNLASRLEGLNKVYGSHIIAAGATVEACGDRFAWRRLDRVAVKGHQHPTWVYELLGEGKAIDPVRLERAGCYEAAWDLYAAGDFSAALGRLDTLLADADDKACQQLRARCTALVASPPGPDWEAVYRPDSK